MCSPDIQTSEVSQQSGCSRRVWSWPRRSDSLRGSEGGVEEKWAGCTLSLKDQGGNAISQGDIALLFGLGPERKTFLFKTVS